ncbi:energy transducer TonB [uncultured Microbulbifer sp.]|uniref:energy transducer TonB family protein n=1 Tax=uncultured Microbulbifer sp. TaxID=348147 RepID=UPI00261C34F9|nr:energy transducer TonB [uncultured Microbulbifer sp.]
MSQLAGPGHGFAQRQQWSWLAAIAGALVMHAAVALYFFRQPDTPLALPPAALPQLVDISLVAAPVAPLQQLPVGPQQQESSPAPRQHNTPQQPEPEPLPEPLPESISEVAIRAAQKKAEREPRQQVPQQPIAKPQETRREDATGEATGDRYVEEASAPVTARTRHAEVASAPTEGALNERQLEARLTWQNRLQVHLERRKRYPRRARVRRQQGTPWVRFTMDRQGKVLAVKLHRASGVATLDREVVALVRRAEPLPRPPEEVVGDPLTMVVPVDFFIR